MSAMRKRKKQSGREQIITTAISEGAEHTLVFVDMLGFAALTKKYPTRLVQHGHEELSFLFTSSSETSNQFHRFQRVLDSLIFDYSLNGPVQAMLFSDCAFLDFGNSLLAAIAATELMRKFVLSRIPVRMGIGRGTFNSSKFSTDITGDTLVTRALFYGTAVVHAHDAERCGGKGLRIFVHPSVGQELALIQRRVRTMPLTEPFENASWELAFLYEQRPVRKKPAAAESDRELFAAVFDMRDPTAPRKVQRQYTDTIKAMNQMRKANSRPTVRIRSKKT